MNTTPTPAERGLPDEATPTFEVGCRVQECGDFVSIFYTSGDTGRVVKIDRDGDLWVIWDNPKDDAQGDHGWCIPRNNCKLIAAAPSAPAEAVRTAPEPLAQGNGATEHFPGGEIGIGSYEQTEQYRTENPPQPSASVDEPWDECYSPDGDVWYDYPDDANFVNGLNVGDTYELTVSHWSVKRTYVVTKLPDETSDDYEVRPVIESALTTAAAGGGEVGNG